LPTRHQIPCAFGDHACACSSRWLKNHRHVHAPKRQLSIRFEVSAFFRLHQMSGSQLKGSATSEGTFRRVGVLVGDADPIVEYDLQRFLPPGVAFHVGRLDMPKAPELSAVESLQMMIDAAPRTALKVTLAEPELFLFACTSASFFHGPDTDHEAAENITRATGVPAISTATAVVEALRALNIKRLFLVTPYPIETNRLEVKFLSAKGFNVAEQMTFGCRLSREVSRIEPKRIAEAILSKTSQIRSAGALFVSCTMLRALEITEWLEELLEVPVVTSNSASIWAVLRKMEIGMTSVRCGRLFRL
jgi:maleate isomerase